MTMILIIAIVAGSLAVTGIVAGMTIAIVIAIQSHRELKSGKK